MFIAYCIYMWSDYNNHQKINIEYSKEEIGKNEEKL